MRIIYTHHKGELAEARRKRARSTLHKQIEALNRIAARVQIIAHPGNPELRKAPSSGKKEGPST